MMEIFLGLRYFHQIYGKNSGRSLVEDKISYFVASFAP